MPPCQHLIDDLRREIARMDNEAQGAAPLSPARERLMEALREMYAAGGRVGLNYALLDKLGFARSMDHIRSTYDEQHPVPSLSRVLAAVEEVVAEELHQLKETDK